MPLDYEPQRPTRVYRPTDTPKTTEPRDERIGFTQPLEKPKGPLEGISIAQVVAGAAAAATSMLLASKIGIAGSVIGAAMSSAVTIVCSQLYRRALDASAEKLKRAQLHDAVYPGPGTDSMYGSPIATTREQADGNSVSSDKAPIRGARMAPTKLQARAAAERAATQRKVAIVSGALAVVAVALISVLIWLGTAGQGLGERPASLFDAQPTTANPADSQPTSQQPAEPGQNAGSGNPGDIASSQDPAHSGDAHQGGADQNAGASASDGSGTESGGEAEANGEGSDGTDAGDGAAGETQPSQEGGTTGAEGSAGGSSTPAGAKLNTGQPSEP